MSEPTSQVHLCEFCKRPILDEHYNSRAKDAKRFCRDKMCKKRRREKAKEREREERATAILVEDTSEVPAGELLPAEDEPKEEDDKDKMECEKGEKDEKTEREAEGDAVDSAAATHTRIEDGHLSTEETGRIEGDGLLPVMSDFDDDDTPRLVKVRLQTGIPLDFLLSEFRTPQGCYPAFPRPTLPHSDLPASETIQALARKRPSSLACIESECRLKDRVRKIEDNVYGRPPEPEPLPPPKDETEAIIRAVEEIQEARRKKEEEAKRKMVGKRRIKVPKIEETPNLRLLCGLTVRQIADVLDEFWFNRPFQVKDRNLLHNMRTKWGRWYNDLEVDMRRRGLNDIRYAKRRAQYKYIDEINKIDEIDEINEIVKAGETDESDEPDPPEPVEVVMIDGAAVSMTPEEAENLLKPQKTVTEILPNGETRIHVVKEIKAPAKIRHKFGVRERIQVSPGTYGELLNMLPYRMEVMITPDEKKFYKDYAAGNLKKEELWKKYRDFGPDDILLIENRAVRHAYRARLVDLLPENRTRSIESQLAEDWAMDAKMISKTGAASIGGRVEAGKLDRYGRRRVLDSFRTRPLVETDGGWMPSDGSGAPLRDDYSEDSAA